MKALKGNTIIKMNTKQKELYALTDEINIVIEKGYNFNLREDRSSLGYVINGDQLDEGVEVLCHYLALEPSYLIENDTILTESERKEGFKIFSIPNDMVFCYKFEQEWHPNKGFLITKRIFKTYNGNLVGIEPELVKHRMYIEKGSIEWDGDSEDVSGKVAITTDNCDYQISWHTKTHKEESIIRTRDREVMAIDDDATKKVKKGIYLIGLTPHDCKTLKEKQNGNTKKHEVII